MCVHSLSRPENPVSIKCRGPYMPHFFHRHWTSPTFLLIPATSKAGYATSVKVATRFWVNQGESHWQTSPKNGSQSQVGAPSIYHSWRELRPPCPLSVFTPSRVILGTLRPCHSNGSRYSLPSPSINMCDMGRCSSVARPLSSGVLVDFHRHQATRRIQRTARLKVPVFVNTPIQYMSTCWALRGGCRSVGVFFALVNFCVLRAYVADRNSVSTSIRGEVRD